MNSNTKQIIFGLFAIAGILFTWYYNFQYLAIDGNDLSTFIADNKLNLASSSVWYDVLIVAFAAIFWMYHEAKRIGMKFWYLYAIVSLVIAIAFGLPFFLLMRERHLQKQATL